MESRIPGACGIWGPAYIALCDQLNATQKLWCIKNHPIALSTQMHHTLLTPLWMSGYQSGVCHKRRCKNCFFARSIPEQSKNLKNCKNQFAKPEKCGSPQANQDWILRTCMDGLLSRIRKVYSFPRAASNNRNLFSHSSGSRKSEITCTELKSVCWQSCILSGAPGEAHFLFSSSFWWLPAFLDWWPRYATLCLRGHIASSFLCASHLLCPL